MVYYSVICNILASLIRATLMSPYYEGVRWGFERRRGIGSKNAQAPQRQMHALLGGV